MELLTLWIAAAITVASVGIGLFGIQKGCGFWKPFWISILIFPVLGWVYVYQK
jgi:purine-cytosine permease-like protein